MPVLKCVSTLRISIWHSKGLERDYMYTNTGSSQEYVVMWQVSLFSIALIWAIRGQMAESTATSHIFIDDIRKIPQGSLARDHGLIYYCSRIYAFAIADHFYKYQF